MKFMKMKMRVYNISPLPIAIMLAIVFGFSSCKSKKKLTETSDPQEIREEIAKEQIESEQPEIIEERVVEKKSTKEVQLDNYFKAIASASSTASANRSINEALTMFSNADAPVLIVIYKEGGKPSYDEPTTIVKYLNYLKDTKNNKAKVEEVVYDTNGKIKELVLKK